MVLVTWGLVKDAFLTRNECKETQMLPTEQKLMNQTFAFETHPDLGLMWRYSGA